jgi:hypothetical protein
MPGLVPGIHVFAKRAARKTWMAGTSPAMTALRVVTTHYLTTGYPIRLRCANAATVDVPIGPFWS